MSYTTERLRLSIPGYNDGPIGPDVPHWFEELELRLDASAVVFDQAPYGSRPDFGTPGRLFFAVDSGVLYYDDGGAWRTVLGDTAVQVLNTGTAPAFLNGWRSPDATRPARFWREGRRVYLAGEASGPARQPIFTLPVGYRPRYKQAIALSTAATVIVWSILKPFNLAVKVDGTVVFEGDTPSSATTVSFDGLSFDLER